MSENQGPFLEEVYREWEPLAFPPNGTPIEDVVEGANRLFEKWFQDGKWLVGAEDAHLISSLRWSKLAVSRRFEEAEAAFEPWLQNPDRYKADPVYRSTDLAYLIAIKMELGKEDEALELFDEKRDLGQSNIFAVELRNMLFTFAAGRSSADQISPAFFLMMGWVVEDIDESLIPSNVLSASTYGGFMDVWTEFAQNWRPDQIEFRD